MSSSNRTQLTSVEEVTLGTTPNTPRMRTRRFTGETLKYVPLYEAPTELRSDRMSGPPILIGTQSDGPINFQLSYPVPGSPLDSDIKSAFYNSWVNSPSRDNDGVADSVITGLATSGTVATVLTGAAFVVGHLVRFSNFGVTLNNGNFRVTTGSATVPAFVGSGITDEAVPPANARMKVIGFAGVAGDITAAAAGLASTLLDFTTLGLAPGQWLKIDSTTTAFGFATAANNTYVRISGTITATSIPLDNLPVGWSVDAGGAKTIRVYCGDQIKNGTTQLGQTIEKGFMGQTVPTYIAQAGMTVSQFMLNLTKKKTITGTVTFMGMGATQGTVTLDASPDAATGMTAYPVMAGSANVGRIGEAGATLTSPNFVETLDFTINNNDTAIEAVDSMGPAGITGHECTVTGNMNTYFGDNSLLTKFFAGTITNINSRVVKNNQAIIITLPAVTYDKNGSPNATGKNVDVLLSLGWTASKEETITNAVILMDRMEFVA